MVVWVARAFVCVCVCVCVCMRHRYNQQPGGGLRRRPQLALLSTLPECRLNSPPSLPFPSLPP